MADLRSAVFPPSSFDELFGEIAILSDEQFDTLATAIQTDGFNIEKPRVEQLAETMDIAPESVAYLLSTASFVYSRFSKLPADRVTPAVEALVRNLVNVHLEESQRSRLAARIARLAQPSPNLELVRKIQRLQKGFLPNLQSVSSFVDIRPNFDEEGRMIQGLIPVTQVRITTDSDESSKAWFVFQVDEEGLKALQKAIERAERKLAALSEAKDLSGLLQKIAR